MKPGEESTTGGERLIVVRVADYRRLLLAAELDDMIVVCEACGAWIDRDDPALATVDDVTLCWAYAGGRPQDAHLCRRDRVAEPDPA